jgi:hypothetical protein
MRRSFGADSITAAGTRVRADAHDDLGVANAADQLQLRDPRRARCRLTSPSREGRARQRCR